MADLEQFLTCNQYVPDPAFLLRDTNLAGPCSGHGNCTLGFCVCEDGWTGRSDWINAEGFDCQNNELSIQLLWTFIALVQILAVIKAWPYFVSRYDSYMHIKKNKMLKGQSYHLWQNPGAFGIAIWYGLGVPVLLLMAIVRISMKQERIGVTVLASVLYTLIRIIFYAAYTVVQPGLLEAVVHGMEGAAQTIQMTRRVTLVFFCAQIISSLLPYVTLARPETAMGVYLTVETVHCLTGIWLASFGFYVEKTLVKVLDRSYAMIKQDKTLVMKSKLKELQAVAIKQASFAAMLYFIQVIFPFFWNKHDIVFPLSMLMYIAANFKLAKTSFTDSENSKLNTSTSPNSGGASDDTEEFGRAGLGSGAVMSFVEQTEQYKNQKSVNDSAEDEYV